MSVTIKGRWGGGPLYVAENANNVREAVKEAVKRSAYLRGADLRGANLRGAGLRSARLRGADLVGADLRDADLWDADLTGADLRSADLRGAYLRYAYLRGADLWGVNLWGANLRDADLRGANLWDAYLRSADLRGADLRGADLRSANLVGADLRDADLRDANLRGANLRGANGINPRHHNDLLILLDQIGKIRAYKLVTADGCGPIHGGITYKVGETVEVADADANPDVECSTGIHLATLPWCVRAWRPGYRILKAEFTAKDIAAIPLSDGKFRCRRVKIVGEVDLKELGLVNDEG